MEGGYCVGEALLVDLTTDETHSQPSKLYGRNEEGARKKTSLFVV
jgi:hypothetical protein